MNKLKIDQEAIKILNQKKIMQLLYRNKELTKQDIAKTLKVSIPTVITNVNEIIQQGFLEESGVGESSGGRKPVIVRFLPNSRYSIGVCITKEQVRIILTNLNFDIIAEKRFNMPESIMDIEALISEINREVENIISENKIPKDKILGIGFSLPGTVDEEKLLLKNAANINLKNISFKAFEANFEFPLYIENEANASADAEAFINFNSVGNSLVFISITEGVGAGIIIGENIYNGFNKGAGEFGHMTIVKGGKKCNCGNKGCWELYASNKALSNEFKKAYNNKNMTLSQFFKISREDTKAKEILDNYLDYLAEGIKNIILILDPENIILGGEICNYKNIIETDLKNKIFKESIFLDEKDCKIFFSDLNENASIFGAALLPMKKLFY